MRQLIWSWLKAAALLAALYSAWLLAYAAFDQPEPQPEPREMALRMILS